MNPNKLRGRFDVSIDGKEIPVLVNMNSLRLLTENEKIALSDFDRDPENPLSFVPRLLYRGAVTWHNGQEDGEVDPPSTSSRRTSAKTRRVRGTPNRSSRSSEAATKENQENEDSELTGATRPDRLVDVLRPRPRDGTWPADFWEMTPGGLPPDEVDRREGSPGVAQTAQICACSQTFTGERGRGLKPKDFFPYEVKASAA